MKTVFGICLLLIMSSMALGAQGLSGLGGMLRKFYDAEFYDECIAAPPEQKFRVGLLGNSDALVPEILRVGGEVIVRTRSTVTCLVSARSLIKLAAEDHNINLIHKASSSASNPRKSTAKEPFKLKPLSPSPPPIAYIPYAVRQSGIEEFRSFNQGQEQPLYGEGVIIAVIESGTIDFKHPDFLNRDGSSRFSSIWDQSRNDFRAPDRFGYGSEWKTEDLNRELARKTSFFKKIGEEGSHPTPIMGTAAGNGNATGDFLGIAPKAQLVFVSTIDDNVHTVDAIRYVFNMADSLKRPCVISFSLGDALNGSIVELMDGSGFLQTAISEMLHEKSGRVIVSGAGNNGHFKRHLHLVENSHKKEDASHFAFLLNRVWFPPKIVKKYKLKPNLDHYLSLRVNSRELPDFRVSIGLSGPTENDLIEAPERWISSQMIEKEGCWLENIREGADTVLKVRIEMKFATDSTTMVQVKLTEHPVNKTNRPVRISFSGLESLEAWGDFTMKFVDSSYFRSGKYPSDFLFPDAEQSNSGPGNALGVLAVGNFWNQTEFTTCKGKVHDFREQESDSTGQLWRNSQMGGFRNGYWSPAIVVPAEGIAAAIVMDAKKDEILLKGKYHGVVGGTSMGAPLLAGVVALFLEKFPDSSNEHVLGAIQKSCDADEFTGTVPNSKCGYGKLNIPKLLR